MTSRTSTLVGAIVALSCKSSTTYDEPVAGWRAGDEREYVVELAMEAHVASSPVTQFSLRGRWIVTALDVDRERALLRAELRGGELRTEHATLQAEYDALESKLDAPFVFALASDGTVGDAYLDPGTPAIVVGIWRTLGSSLQFVRGTEDPSGAWTTEEYDTTGRYVARYRPGETGGSYTKQKLRYVRTTTAGITGRRTSVAISSEIVETSGDVQLDARGGLARVATRDRVRTTAAQMMTIDWVSELSLVRTAERRTSRDARWKQLVAGRERYAPDRLFIDKPDTRRRDEALVRGRQLDDVLAELDALERAPASGDDGRNARDRARDGAFVALRAILRVQPGATERALALIDAASPHSPILIDALGSAGTADAQRALRDLLVRPKLDPHLVKLAAISLSRSPDPQLDSMRALIARLDDRWLGTQASYGIGTMARRLRAAGKTVELEAALAVLRDRLEHARTALQTTIALRGIANAGAASLYPVVARYFDHVDDGVRAAAVEALQRMDDARVDSAIASRLENDPEPSVRLAACRAARLRDPSPELARTVEQRVRVEPDAHVRLGLVRVLAAWAPAHPAVEATLAWVGEHDREAAIRRHARQGLARPEHR